MCCETEYLLIYLENTNVVLFVQCTSAVAREIDPAMLTALLACVGALTATAPASKPHLVFVMVDE